MKISDTAAHQRLQNEFIMSESIVVLLENRDLGIALGDVAEYTEHLAHELDKTRNVHDLHGVLTGAVATAIVIGAELEKDRVSGS